MCVVLIAFCLLFFFFSSRRRHTRYWRDWSSDVCSSDLPLEGVGESRQRVDAIDRSASRNAPAIGAARFCGTLQHALIVVAPIAGEILAHGGGGGHDVEGDDGVPSLLVLPDLRVILDVPVLGEIDADPCREPVRLGAQPLIERADQLAVWG